MGRLNSSQANELGPSSRTSTQDEDIEAPAVPGSSKGLLSDKYTVGEELGRGAFGQVCPFKTAWPDMQQEKRPCHVSLDQWQGKCRIAAPLQASPQASCCSESSELLV